MPSYNYYPHGFRVPNKQPHDEFLDADGEVMELWQRYNKVGGFDKTDPALVRQVVQCVKRLLPDPIAFAVCQETNHHVDSYKWDYLYDAVKCILTGKRTISNDSVIRMLVLDSINDTTHTDRVNVERKFPLREIQQLASKIDRTNYTSNTTILEHWFSTVGSIDEIVCTLYVLFGNKS